MFWVEVHTPGSPVLSTVQEGVYGIWNFRRRREQYLAYIFGKDDLTPALCPQAALALKKKKKTSLLYLFIFLSVCRTLPASVS